MRWNGLMLMAAVGLSSLGCGGDTAADKKVSEAKVKIGEAASATVDAAKAKRDEYAVELNKQLDVLSVKYDEMKVQAAKAQGEAKIVLDKKLEEAKVKRDEAAKALAELKTASAERWEKVKTGAGKAFDELKKSFD